MELLLRRASAVFFGAILTVDPRLAQLSPDLASASTSRCTEGRNVCHESLALPAHAAFNRSVLEMSQTKSSHENRGGAISAGYTAHWIEQWIPEVENDENLGGDVVKARSVARNAYKRLRELPTLGPLFRRPAAAVVEYVFGPNLAEPHWLPQIIDSPWQYILGFRGDWICATLVVFLEQLQEKGKAVDGAGHVVARLLDNTGSPYRNLVEEYLLHERFEMLGYAHDESIAMTTQLFGHGSYARSREKGHSEHELLPLVEGLLSTEGVQTYTTALRRYVELAEQTMRLDGIEVVHHGRPQWWPTLPWLSGIVFRRPGETPLGRALRQFIDWRFSSDLHLLFDEPVAIVFWDLSGKAVRSLCGRVEWLQPGHSLGILHTFPILEIPLSCVLTMFQFEGQWAHPLTLLAAIARIEQGESVELTAEQVRVFAKGEGPLAKIFQKLITKRDAIGLQVWSAQGQGCSYLSETLQWIIDLVIDLQSLDLALVLSSESFEVAFNAWSHIPQANGFVRYDNMPDPHNSEAFFVEDLTQHVQNLLLFFHKADLRRRSGGGRGRLNHLERRGPEDHASRSIQDLVRGVSAVSCAA